MAEDAVNQTEAAEETQTKSVAIPTSVTVGVLAESVGVTVPKLITELMRNGIMATVNQKIDFETAQIIVEELDLGITLEVEQAEDDERTKHRNRELKDDAVTRPPIIAVMGHVDHGKTSLLDAIRGAKVAAGEAGGITQHISAYQVEHDKRKITFMDTPGHEAFAALREHGAKLTDLAVIVVAADDGIKPQTEEAIKFAAKAGVKIIVALNKIDKPGADLNRAMQQLTDHGLQPEEWGGETIVVPTSATTGEGIDKLLEMILLVTDVEELKAEEDVPAEGLVIEAHMETGKGPVATVLVEHGFLKKGQSIVAGNTFAKVRTLSNHSGKELDMAGPATPAIVTGFKEIPRFGDIFIVAKNEKEARKQAQKGTGRAGDDSRVSSSSDLLNLINQARDTKQLPVIVKADVQGSLKSVIDSLRGIQNDEVSVRIVSSGVGAITENDVVMANTSGAIVYGFNVDMPVGVKQVALRDKTPVRIYKVIYELIDDARENLGALLDDEVIVTDVGRLLIKGVFRTTPKLVICGGEVTKGVAKGNVLATVFRDDKELAEVEVVNVKMGDVDANEVAKGEMCGLELKTTEKLNLKEGDRLEFFTRETKTRSL